MERSNILTKTLLAQIHSVEVIPNTEYRGHFHRLSSFTIYWTKKHSSKPDAGSSFSSCPLAFLLLLPYSLLWPGKVNIPLCLQVPGAGNLPWVSSIVVWTWNNTLSGCMSGKGFPGDGRVTKGSSTKWLEHTVLSCFSFTGSAAEE